MTEIIPPYRKEPSQGPVGGSEAQELSIPRASVCWDACAEEVVGGLRCTKQCAVADRQGEPLTVATAAAPAAPVRQDGQAAWKTLADAFIRSADWLDKGVLHGPARTHPLVGTGDYRLAAEGLRRLAAHPPAAVVGQALEALTDEKIDAAFKDNHNPEDSPWVNWRRFARAIAALAATKEGN